MHRARIEIVPQEGLTHAVSFDPRELERLAEITEYSNSQDITSVQVQGRDPEGILCVEICSDSDLPHYECLYVTERGRIASAMLNQPEYFDSYGSFLNDAQGRVS